MPLAPFTATVEVFFVAPLEALTVMVVVPLALSDAGLNVIVTPDCWPVALKVTAELKPPATARVTVAVLLAPPWVTVRLVGETVSEKFLIVKVSVVVRARDPFVPVTVTV